MAEAYSQFRNFIKGKMSVPHPAYVGSRSMNGVDAASGGKKRDDSLEPHPSVGFRVTYHPSVGTLTVTVIGARHLPANISNIPAAGYIVKVKLFPGKDKFETEVRYESWPSYNASFNFHIPPNKNYTGKTSPPLDSVLTSSKFITFTIFGLDKTRRRKSIGSATWPLDHSVFATKRHSLNPAVVETSDIWRRVTDFTTGLSTFSTSLQHKRILLRAKDQVELFLCHTVGGVGEDDILTLRINRLRWGIDKTKEYQHKEAELYVKLSVTNCFGQVMRCQKTSDFSPSISVHWKSDDIRSVLEVSVPPVGPRNKGYQCVVTLCGRVGRTGKKVYLGRAVIPQSPENPETDSDHWTTAMQKAGTPITQWHNLLPVTK